MNSVMIWRDRCGGRARVRRAGLWLAAAAMAFILVSCDLIFGNIDKPVPTTEFSFAVSVPATGLIHSYEATFVDEATVFSVRLQSHMTNSIGAHEERDTSRDPDGGYIVAVTRESSSGYVLSVTAKPTLYPPGVFRNNEEFIVLVLSSGEPTLDSVTFFDITGESVP